MAEERGRKLQAGDSAEPLVEMSVRPRTEGERVEPIVIDVEAVAPRKTSSTIKQRRGSNARKASVDQKRTTTKEVRVVPRTLCCSRHRRSRPTAKP